jgi:hypothetical protein
MEEPRIVPLNVGWPLACEPIVPVVTAIADCWLAPWPLIARLACSPRAAALVEALPIGVVAGATM